MLSNTTFDHTVSIVVLRGSQEVHLQLTLKQTLTQAWTSKEYLGWWWKPLGYFGSREPKRLGVRVD